MTQPNSKTTDAGLKQQKRRKFVSQAAMAMALASVLLVSTPRPAHAWLTDIILLATQAMQKLQLGFMAAALTTGQLMQSKISQNNTNAVSASNRATAQAQVAGEIAYKNAMPKNYSYCSNAKETQGQDVVYQDADSLARAGSISNRMMAADYKTVSDIIVNWCKAGVAPDTEPYTTICGNVASNTKLISDAEASTGGQYAGSHLTIMSCFDRDDYVMPSGYVPQKNKWTKIPEGNAGDSKYMPWIACYATCLAMTPMQTPVTNTSGKVLPGTLRQIAEDQRAPVRNAASTACLANLMARTRIESGTGHDDQKDACERAQKNGSLGVDVDGKEVDCSKGISKNQLARLTASCESSASCWSKKTQGLDAQHLYQFQQQQAMMRLMVRGNEMSQMKSLLSAMIASADAPEVGDHTEVNVSSAQ